MIRDPLAVITSLEVLLWLIAKRKEPLVMFRFCEWSIDLLTPSVVTLLSKGWIETWY